MYLKSEDKIIPPAPFFTKEGGVREFLPNILALVSFFIKEGNANKEG